MLGHSVRVHTYIHLFIRRSFDLRLLIGDRVAVKFYYPHNEQSPKHAGCFGDLLKGVAMGRAAGLHLVVLGAGDDLVLQLFGHIVEVVAIASHANEQVAILVGMLLGIE